MPNTFTSEGLELVKYFEGFRAEAYLDTNGIPTIGYGATHYANGKSVEMGETISLVDADLLLLEEIQHDGCHYVDAWCGGVELSDNQYSALSSFIYNCGAGTFRNSSIFLELKAGNNDSAANNFLEYSHDHSGNEVNGLIIRRKAEREMFLGQNWRAVID